MIILIVTNTIIFILIISKKYYHTSWGRNSNTQLNIVIIYNMMKCSIIIYTKLFKFQINFENSKQKHVPERSTRIGTVDNFVEYFCS